MKLKFKTTSAIVTIVIIVTTIAILENIKPERTSFSGGSGIEITGNEGSEERVANKLEQYERAKEISTPDAFINTDEIYIADFIGEKVILVDFWTYSCINCQRTIPHLNAWHEAYADDGLVILGIHTPEFEFEKSFENVSRAVEKFDIKYPVIMDNDYSTWRAYKNRYWPRKYLIDIDGFIVYDHIGEGAYDETEQKIVELLNERNRVLGEADTVEAENVNSIVGDQNLSKVKTPEIYFGGDRLQYISNLPSRECIGFVCNFSPPEETPLNTFSLGGNWIIKEESAELKNGEGSIILHFSASKVNIVAGSLSDKVEADIYLDGSLIDENNWGADIKNNKVVIGPHDLYNIVDLNDGHGEHVLEIRFKDGDVNVFTFTFG